MLLQGLQENLQIQDLPTIMVSLLVRILSMMRCWSVLGKESMFMVVVVVVDGNDEPFD
jgi:hypothetical protein